MKVRVNVKLFREAFALVASVAPGHAPKPILENVRLRVADGAARLEATDLEVAISRPVPGVDVEAEGSAILPTARLRAILATSRDEALTIEVAGSSGGPELVVAGINGRFRLPHGDPDLFPEVPGKPALVELECLAPDLLRAIRRTRFATDKESTRYALGGVLFSFHVRTGLHLVGTDGRRLAQQFLGAAPTAGPDVSSVPLQPVVPVKALKLLESALADEEGPVCLSFPGGGFLARIGGARIFSRLVEGRFPRYQDVFPEAFASRVDLAAGALADWLDRAAITASEESRGVTLDFGEGRLVLAARSPGVGESRVEAAVPWGDQEPLRIAFDPRYLVPALRTLAPDAVVFLELVDHKTAAVFRSADDYTYVVMPLTLEK